MYTAYPAIIPACLNDWGLRMIIYNTKVRDQLWRWPQNYFSQSWESYWRNRRGRVWEMIKSAKVTKDHKDRHLRSKFGFFGRLMKEFPPSSSNTVQCDHWGHDTKDWVSGSKYLFKVIIKQPTSFKSINLLTYMCFYIRLCHRCFIYVQPILPKTCPKIFN